MTRILPWLGFSLAAAAFPGFAASPAQQDVSIPAAPGTYTYTWSGIAPAGGFEQAAGTAALAADLGGCSADPTGLTGDTAAFAIKTADGLYGRFVVKAQFKIDWTATGEIPDNPLFGQPDTLPDLALTVLDGSSVISTSDGSQPTEQVTTQNPAAGDWSAIVCPAISSADTPYTGTLTVTVAPAASVTAPPSAAATGLAFSASLVDELQYYEGEPLVTVDNDGTIYTCGPAGSAYPAADYAQASTDGGDQFNRLGDPATGRMGLMGGGDCAMATGLERNAQGNYTLAYAGLSNLAQFTVSTSPDKGATLTNQPFSSTAPVADRQWLAFTDASNVFLVYKNEQSVGVVHHSTDGGLTYGPPVPVAPGPSVIGAMHSMTKDENPAHNGKAALYFPWTAGNTLEMAISPDAGATWGNCTVAESKGSPSSLFPAMDHDTAGNIYLAYTDQADFNTYLVTIPAAELKNCTGPSDLAALAASQTIGVTFPALQGSAPLQVNRDKVLSSVMPWVAAGGIPGRVAVAFYGSPIAGPVDDPLLPHVWDVYVSQSLDALSANPAVAQVKVTTHPMHYDQICIGGVACTTGGDRSLSDFFAIAYNKANGELDLVFNRSGKKPGDGNSSSGPVTATTFVRQIGGPSNGGGTVADAGRPALRQATTDPTGDAYGSYSSLVVNQGRTQLPALDFTGVSVDAAQDLQTKSATAEGGFTVTMHVKDLSGAALAQALASTNGQSLVWMFYYWDGYTPHAAGATWDGSGFTFGISGASEAGSCSTPSAATLFVGCTQYAMDTAIDGAVDTATGTIRMTIPLSMIGALADVPAPARSPAQVPAQAGDRVYSAAAYSFVNLTGIAVTPTQTFETVDNTAAMDFDIPAGGATRDAGQGSGLLLGKGGAFDLLALLPLLGAGWLRRRRR